MVITYLLIIIFYYYNTPTVVILWSNNNNNNIHLFSLVQQLGDIEKQITKRTNKYPTRIHFAEKKRRFNALFYF